MLELIVRVLVFIFIISATFFGSLLDIQSFIIRVTFLPLLFIVIFTRPNFDILKRREFIAFAFVLFFAVISVLTPETVNMQLYFKELYNITLSLFIFFVFFNLIRKYALLLTIFYAYLVVSIMFVIFVLMNANVIYAIRFERFEEIFDANYYGYYFFLTMFGMGYLIHFREKRKIIYLYYPLVFLFLVVGLISGSRGTVAFVLISHLVIIYLMGKKNFYIQLSLATLFGIIYGFGAFEDFLVYQRYIYTIEGIEMSRIRLMQLAAELFMQHPILGVGAGNFLEHEPTAHFSHSTFFEIASGMGIFGLIAITYFLIYPLRRVLIFRKKQILSKNESYYWIGFFSVFILYNFLYTFYIAPYIMLFVFTILSNLYKKEDTLNESLAHQEKMLKLRETYDY